MLNEVYISIVIDLDMADRLTILILLPSLF